MGVTKWPTQACTIPKDVSVTAADVNISGDDNNSDTSKDDGLKGREKCEEVQEEKRIQEMQ